MPLGIISDEELQAELSNSSVEYKSRGRNAAPEVPNEIRKLIAEEANLGTSAKELSETFKVSESSVSAYKKGATSTASYNKPEAELKKHRDAIREAVLAKAQKRLENSLDALTAERIGEAKPRDIAGIAKDMSVVMKNMTPEVEQTAPGVQFVINVPAVKKESDYEIIEGVVE